jgi:uncharacterized delta-60 repeat protein
MRAVRKGGAFVLASCLVACGGGGGDGPPGGSFDVFFGLGGFLTTDFYGFGYDDHPTAVAVQTDGKIVVAGYDDGGAPDFAVARYLPDGTLDPTFGVGGIFTHSIGASDFAQAVGIQADGKIVVAGWSTATGDMAVIRLTTLGALDPTFGGGDGEQDLIFGGSAQCYALAIQADGKIVLAGLYVPGATPNFALARLTTAGVLDPTFGGGDGLADYPLGMVDIAYAVDIQADGRIVAAGTSNVNGTNDFFVIRTDSAGALDGTFSTDGIDEVAFGADDQARAVIVQPDGKILLGGWWDGGSSDFALARFLPGGGLDLSFDVDGKANMTFGPPPGGLPYGGAEFGFGMALQSDGKIVMVGDTDAGGGVSRNVGVCRFTSVGSLDSSFDGDGRLTIDLGGDEDGTAVALDYDGGIVVVGSTNIGPDIDFAVFRMFQ